MCFASHSQLDQPARYTDQLDFKCDFPTFHLELSILTWKPTHPPKPADPNWKLSDPMLATTSDKSLLPETKTSKSIGRSSYENQL